MNRYTLCLCLFLFATQTAAQVDTTALKRSIVRISVPTTGGNESGSGFIAGTDRDSVYIITAGHVLKHWNKTKAISVIPGERRDSIASRVIVNYYFNENEFNDFAILSAPLRDYHCPLTKLDTVFNGRLPLFYFHTGVLRAESDDEQFFLERYNDAAGTAQSSLFEIEDGDSGSAVFIKHEQQVFIAGMVLEGTPYCKLLQSARIKQLALRHIGHKFQLIATD